MNHLCATSRRIILKYLYVGCLMFLLVNFIGCSDVKTLIRKIKNKFKKQSVAPSDNKRSFTTLPDDGEKVSLETALNTRCTSDYDDDSHLFHWGMFDKSKKLNDDQIAMAIRMARIPFLNPNKVNVKSNKNIISYSINSRLDGLEKEWSMVQSGMQQQAISLVCAALGIGLVFKNQGMDGITKPNGDHVNIKMKLDAMKPSYNQSYWTQEAPQGERSWLPGNLPDPDRIGKIPLKLVLENVIIESKNQKKSTIETIGQMLWAARGRTPHFYKSTPWGMTIPTWAGLQDLSNLFLVTKKSLYRYQNIHKKRPTHTLKQLGSIVQPNKDKLTQYMPSWNSFIICAVNETHARALWEVGYMVLNMVLQAASLHINYKIVMLDDKAKRTFIDMGISNPKVAVALSCEKDIVL